MYDGLLKKKKNKKITVYHRGTRILYALALVCVSYCILNKKKNKNNVYFYMHARVYNFFFFPIFAFRSVAAQTMMNRCVDGTVHAHVSTV